MFAAPKADPTVTHPNCILIVDDHPLFLEALQGSIKAIAPGTLVRTASSIPSAKQSLSTPGDAVDMVLLDLALPGTKGFDGLLELRTLHPKTPIAVVSAHEEPRVIEESLRYGAAGFIAKSASRDEIATALRDVMDGMVTVPAGYKPPNPQVAAEGDALAKRLKTLTPKQLSVLRMLRQGLLNKQIAHELKIEETTVKAHVSEILRKLNVASRTQAVIEAQKIDFDTVFSELQT
jgi:DNA-binding NarL/FixJ family response regulator